MALTLFPPIKKNPFSPSKMLIGLGWLLNEANAQNGHHGGDPTSNRTDNIILAGAAGGIVLTAGIVICCYKYFQSRNNRIAPPLINVAGEDPQEAITERSTNVPYRAL